MTVVMKIFIYYNCREPKQKSNLPKNMKIINATSH